MASTLVYSTETEKPKPVFNTAHDGPWVKCRICGYEKPIGQPCGEPCV